MQEAKLDLRTPQGEPVDCEFMAQESSVGIAFSFPGWAYGTDRPPFHFLKRMLSDRGFDLLDLRYWFQVQRVERDEERDAEWYERSLGEARTAVSKALARRPYDQVLLIGKSYGTRILNDLAIDLPELAKARLIYLTPVFANPGFTERFQQVTQPSLLVLGTDDPSYDPQLLKRLQAQRHFALTVLPHVHHGLEDPSDYVSSIRVLETICRDADAFLALTR